MVTRNSASGTFAYIWQSKWVGIIERTQRAQVHFLRDVLVTVASLDLKVPFKRADQNYWGVPCPPGPFPFYGTVVAQFVFLFLLREIFRETSTEMDVNTVKVIVKSKLATTLHGLYYYRL